MFSDLAEACYSFVEICRWRFTGQLHTNQPWAENSPHFEEIKTLLTTWHKAFDLFEGNLMKSDVDARLAHQDLKMQCRVLSNAMIYSASEKLAGCHKTRPVAVDVSKAGRMAVTYRMYPPGCEKMKKLDWSTPNENASTCPAIWQTRIRQKATDGPLFLDLVMGG